MLILIALRCWHYLPCFLLGNIFHLNRTCFNLMSVCTALYDEKFNYIIRHLDIRFALIVLRVVF